MLDKEIKIWYWRDINIWQNNTSDMQFLEQQGILLPDTM